MEKLDKEKILAALAGKTARRDAEKAAGILCSEPKPAPEPGIIDDLEAALAPDDGSPAPGSRQAVRMEAAGTAFGPLGDMISMRKEAIAVAWLGQALEQRAGRDAADRFLDACMSGPVGEPLYLAEILRLAYGPDGIRERVGAAVFSRPEYAPWERAAAPYLEECTYLP